MMLLADAPGFCLHNERDVLLCGLRADLAASTLQEVARLRGALEVLKQASAVIPIIGAAARANSGDSKTGATHNYTTRCPFNS